LLPHFKKKKKEITPKKTLQEMLLMVISGMELHILLYKREEERKAGKVDCVNPKVTR
jgi:hypothetical protein